MIFCVAGLADFAGPQEDQGSR